MITYKKEIAVLGEECTVEEAESLFAWLVAKPTRAVDASACVQMHTAVLQVLLLFTPKLTKMPTDPWVMQALAHLKHDH